MSQPRRVLTGITTTGTPHLGNYVGAIRPAILASQDPQAQSFLFMADYHALIKCDDPARIERSRLEIAATWLAAGLDPQRVVFYRQSDIPEIPELTWLLTCVTSKGLMNRAHAYKAAVDDNTGRGEDPDAGVTMGLYSYPILMAADILMFNAHQVPVGRDQVQHIEMARDIAQRFNHQFGAHFTLPEVVIEESVATLPGLDGRKMSKSYDNTIPLFEGGARGLRDGVMRIVTDSRAPGEPKDPDASNLFAIHRAFAGADETAALRADFAAGIAWGDAKQRLFERLDAELAPLRAEYERLMRRPGDIEDILQEGARKARALAGPFLAQLRAAVGLRDFRAIAPARAQRDATQRRAGTPQFKQYREAGLFWFKLLDGDGRLLLHSDGFASPKEAGQRLAALRAGHATLGQMDRALLVDHLPLATLAEDASLEAVQQALLAIAVAEG